jgi:hypothetical protein
VPSYITAYAAITASLRGDSFRVSVPAVAGSAGRGEPGASSADTSPAAIASAIDTTTGGRSTRASVALAPRVGHHRPRNLAAPRDVAAATAGIIPTTTRRAACRRICTSARSRHTRSRTACGALRWDPSRVGDRPTGSREGWWGLPRPAEAFLDELITWRELGYGFCFHRADHARYASLPEWARRSLAAHARDPRPVHYPRVVLEAAGTHEPVWNAAQRQLVAEGRIHNYLRMLWGKKILEWSASPRAALAALIELNIKYAVDGRDPNSYSGIFWTLGPFDRPWGPVRPIFGSIRYMSSEATRRKLHLRDYLTRWGSGA